MNIANNSTPVLVLSPHHHGALGIFRSLGKLGVPVYGVEDRRWAPPLRSRYCRGVFHWDLCHAPSSDSVARLLEIAGHFDRRPILIPSDDASAVLVQQFAAELQAAYRFPLLPSGLVQRLSSKKELYLLCREYGFPTPQTAFPRSRGELLESLERFTFPVMLKGIDDRVAAGRTKFAMRLVGGAEELLTCYEALGALDQRNVMIQEYIPGDTSSVWMFNGYFSESSECLAGFTGRKLRQRPANTGITTLGICQKNEAFERPIRELLRSLGYRGIVDLGCRYDQRDGQYKLLDVNPRIGCTFRLYVDPSGMDVVRACYLDLTGQPVQAEAAVEGRKWLVENQDLLELPAHLKARKLTILEWLRSLSGVREMAWFDSRDLGPLGSLLTGALRRLRLEPNRGQDSQRETDIAPSACAKSASQS